MCMLYYVGTKSDDGNQKSTQCNILLYIKIQIIQVQHQILQSFLPCTFPFLLIFKSGRQSLIMKISLSIISPVLLTSSTAAFSISSTRTKACFISSPVPSSPTVLYGTPGMDLSGNSWKPDSEKMGSTGMCVYACMCVCICVRIVFEFYYNCVLCAVGCCKCASYISALRARTNVKMTLSSSCFFIVLLLCLLD
jgi:hypothetical protein